MNLLHRAILPPEVALSLLATFGVVALFVLIVQALLLWRLVNDLRRMVRRFRVPLPPAPSLTRWRDEWADSLHEKRLARMREKRERKRRIPSGVMPSHRTPY